MIHCIKLKLSQREKEPFLHEAKSEQNKANSYLFVCTIKNLSIFRSKQTQHAQNFTIHSDC